MANPDEAFEIAVKHIPEMQSSDMPLQKAVLDRSIEVWESDRLGETTTEAWQTSVDFMQAAGFIQEAPRVSSLFTNRFVEGAK